MQHALSFDIRHLSPNASWNFLGLLKQASPDNKNAQAISRKIIRDIQVAMPFEKQDREGIQFTEQPLINPWVEGLSGIPCISIEVNMLAYHEHTLDEFQVYRTVSFANTAGHHNVNFPRLLEFGQNSIEQCWDEFSGEEVAKWLSTGAFEKLILAFVGIPEVMKLTIKDGADALLRFDRLDPEDRAGIKLEAQAYRKPDAIRFTITKRDEGQSED